MISDGGRSKVEGGVVGFALEIAYNYSRAAEEAIDV